MVTVGYTPTIAATAAVHWAATRAAAGGAELRIAWCHDGRDVQDAHMVGTDVAALAEGDVSPLDAIASAIRAAHPRLGVSTAVIDGSPRGALVTGEQPPELLVAGRSHRNGPSRFWQGTTTQWLSRHSACPFVMVPEQTAPAAPVRVVVGTDGSDAALGAVRWACDEADHLGAELLVIHAWEAPYRAVDPASEQARDLARVDARCVLDRAVAVARERSGGRVTAELVESPPGAALLDAASPGDLLVVGSSGHGAVSSVLLGSTVNRLLDRSQVPVVVVRSTT